MAQQTFLQLVNRVLVNLRESTVATVAVGYPQLVATYVNKAKEKVEDAWQWRSLVIPATFTTVIGQQSYVLTSTGTPTVTVARDPDERAYIARNTDDEAQVFATNPPVVARLDEYAYEDLIGENRESAPLVNQIPYAFAYTTPNNIPTLFLARGPDAAYTMEVRMVVPQAELVSDTDLMIVDYRAVVSLATALAMQERGEELGTNSDLYMAAYADELTRAINTDREQGTVRFKND
jgi:hypothetical protein